ncbi:tumor necrosis factor receptor superfamily member 16-like [Pristis pectinata]|uniref:tumor necrosis factor receptor superfamily member 16-like n=1 Tax=Pristis pectinata TaxID=685728 RepID=UPI00223E6CFD|nr:tumor necrosis factor receptor superfamily member 16-like [Pristis pectinata]
MICHRLLYLLLTVLPGIAAHQDYPTIRKSLSDCSNKTTEYIARGLQLCCSKCRPGTHQLQACSKDMDTQCRPCGNNQYTAYWNTLKKCRGCEAQCSEDQEEVQACTSTSMRVCLCREGSYCIDAAGKTCNQCRKYSECKEGYGVIEQGTKDTDVKCAPCASGTFSDKVSYTEECRPHTECETKGRKTLRKGSSMNDTVCSELLLPMPPAQTKAIPTSTPQPSTLTQVTHWTEKEEPTMIHGTETSLDFSSSSWLVVICVGIFALITVAVVITVCVNRKRKGRKPDLKADVPVKNVSQMEAICLISGNEIEPEGVVPRNGTCGQNSGALPVGDQLPSLSRSSSGESRGVRRKPDVENSLKEEDQMQAHFATLNNYSQMDCQEDQGYISRESRPSSGTPSPVLEFIGNPTVSVTINTGKCFVNCCHCPEDKAAGPSSDEDQYHAPEEEEGIEVDEGFPIQEEQKDSESGKWKEDGGSVEAVQKDCWWYNSVPHQEDGKESHLPVQDTSGNVY